MTMVPILWFLCAISAKSVTALIVVGRGTVPHHVVNGSVWTAMIFIWNNAFIVEMILASTASPKEDAVMIVASTKSSVISVSNIKMLWNGARHATKATVAIAATPMFMLFRTAMTATSPSVINAEWKRVERGGSALGATKLLSRQSRRIKRLYVMKMRSWGARSTNWNVKLETALKKVLC
jgi:hypothetical protein